MARKFNKSQRQTLFILADGKCRECGDDLGDDWEADHVDPWSKGGETTLINGQALCQKCNRKKGDKVTTYRKWQLSFFDTYLRKNQNDFLLVATPGGGKTKAALGVAEKLLLSGDVVQIIVVCPTEALKRQWAWVAAQFGIQLDPDWKGTIIKEGFQGIAVTYAAVATSTRPLFWHCQYQKTLVIFDEIHHAGDQKTWGVAVKSTFSEAARRLCLSGTPFRSDNNEIPFVKYIGGESLADFKYSYGDAIDDDVCRNVFFPAFDGDFAWWDGKKGEKGEFVESYSFDEELSEEDERRRLRIALDPSRDFVKSMLQAAVRYLDDLRAEDSGAGGLIVAIDMEHANELAKLLQSLTGESPVLVHSDIPDSTRLIERFEKSDKKWIVSVRMVSEGIDIPRLRVGVYATNITTELLFRQIIGRVIRRTSEDDTWAAFFVPKDQRLVEFMGKIKEEAKHHIDKKYQDEIARLSRTPSTEERSKQEIHSVYATHKPEGDVTVTDGVVYQRDFAKEAKRLCDELGIKANEAQAAMLVKKLTERTNGTSNGSTHAKEPEERPAHEKVKDLRKIVHSRAYQIANQIAEENRTSRTASDIVKIIHAEWAKKPGRHKQAEAGIEELKDKLTWLDTQLSEPWKYIR